MSLIVQPGKKHIATHYYNCQRWSETSYKPTPHDFLAFFCFSTLNLITNVSTAIKTLDFKC